MEQANVPDAVRQEPHPPGLGVMRSVPLFRDFGVIKPNNSAQPEIPKHQSD
ncbi:MAG: hypothetical protein WCL39_02210 [Armatimonadota bacterium]